MSVRVAVLGFPLAALAAALTVPRVAAAAEPASTAAAELRDARAWLLPQWDDEREKALQAKAAAVAGPGYFTTPLQVPGSDRRYTQKQVNDAPPDWWPQEHPPMPAIVGAGVGDATACAACHLPDGGGTLANAALAGLPQAYLLEQVNAFRSGARINSEMHAESLAVTDADLKVAAAYFAGLHLSGPRASVIEAAQVPATHVETWLRVPTPGGSMEPIGNRIIEVPENVQAAKLADSHARFIAYVPPGSLESGRRLATAGDDRTQACTVCHGSGLRGTTVAPPIAGRSPTYLGRQLVAFATGERSGPANAPMAAEVSRLDLAQIIAVSAYAASLPP